MWCHKVSTSCFALLYLRWRTIEKRMDAVRMKLMQYNFVMDGCTTVLIIIKFISSYDILFNTFWVHLSNSYLLIGIIIFDWNFHIEREAAFFMRILMKKCQRFCLFALKIRLICTLRQKAFVYQGVKSGVLYVSYGKMNVLKLDIFIEIKNVVP